MLAEYNYRIVNIDSTVIAQQPKLKPHIDEMRKISPMPAELMFRSSALRLLPRKSSALQADLRAFPLTQFVLLSNIK